MKKLLKAFVLVTGVLLGVGIAGAGYLIVRKPAVAPPWTVQVPMTQERIARGRHIYNLSDCDGCHSLRDFTRFGGPVVEGHRGEGVEFPKEMGLPGRVISRNITPDVETGLGAWTDGEKIRAIREGISRDGSMLFPMMPYAEFRQMSDDDVMALVAYLNTLAPVKHKVPRSEIHFPVSVLTKSAPQPAGHVPPVDSEDRAALGAYLVAMAGCAGCHTPDHQTGIGRWTEQDFVDKFHQYREYAEKGSPLSAPENFTIMPWLNFSRLEAGDLKAIYHHLRKQKPVYHAVDSHPGYKK